MDHANNFFGWTNNTWGVILMLIANLLDGLYSCAATLAEDEGVSSNAVTFYNSIASVLLILFLDAYYWQTGYSVGNVNKNNTDNAKVCFLKTQIILQLLK